MKLSKSNTICITISQDAGFFRLNSLYDYSSNSWRTDFVWLTLFPDSNQESTLCDNPNWLRSLYLALKASIDHESRTIGHSDENEFIQAWFDEFSTEKDIFQISNDFINAYEDLQKLNGNAECGD